MSKEHVRGMTMRYPATRWQDALPTGSGIVGALVYGNIQNDIILLNHDALYYPREVPPNIDVSDLLPEVRRLIEAGQYREAAQVMPDAYAERTGTETGSTSVGRDPYQPFCSLSVKMETDGPFCDYRRGVDFTTGRAWMEWTDNKASYTREVFASRLTDMIYMRIRSSKPGSVSCRLAFCKTRNEQVGMELTHTAALPGDIELDDSTTASAEEQTLSFTGKYANGFTFGATGRLTAPGGTVQVDGDSLVVTGADEVVLQVQLSLGDLDVSGIESVEFDSAFKAHAALHSEIFNRVQLDLGGEQQSNEELLMAAYDGEVPSPLIQRMFEFGRFLLICSSRPGGWPANLQGLWNGDYAPAWNSDIHTDENVQMNYWQACQGNISETMLPFFEYFERFIDQFRDNAKNIFGCRGILLPIAFTTNGYDTPRTWSNWTAAAGWIGQHFYDYYLFTGDLDFLRDRALPWLKETALFYEDFLFEGDDGKLMFNPSLSPENRPTGSNSLMCMNATMDIAVCREVLSSLCDGCEKLGIDAEGVTRWRSMLERLPEYDVNEDGAMKEWLHPAFKDNYHHRHQSHIYPVFPGFEVTEESDPKIYEACRVAVEKRLVIGLTSQTGWSMAHMANIYARLGQGDRALDCMELLTRSSTGPNLLTYHNDWRGMGLSCFWGKMPPFQIDANFGIAAAVLEMLVFSKPGLIKLLPALPAKWNLGAVSGICCRGGITVNLKWNVEIGVFVASLVAKSDQTVSIRLPAWVQDVQFEGAPDAAEAGDVGYWNVTLKAGTPVMIAAG